MQNKKIKACIALILSSFFAVNALAACKGNEGDSQSENINFESDAVLYTEGMEYTESTKGTPKQYTALTFDYLGGEDVMPIGGFYGPYMSGGSLDGNVRGDLLTSEVFHLIKDAGINMIVYGKDMWQGETGGTTANLVLDL